MGGARGGAYHAQPWRSVHKDNEVNPGTQNNNNAMQYTNDMNVGDENGPTDITSAIFYDEIMTKEIV